MHILIIGAAGMVGRKLTGRLVADGRLGGNEVTGLTLADVIVPPAPEGFKGEVRTVASISRSRARRRSWSPSRRR